MKNQETPTIVVDNDEKKDGSKKMILQNPTNRMTSACLLLRCYV